MGFFDRRGLFIKLLDFHFKKSLEVNYHLNGKKNYLCKRMKQVFHKSIAMCMAIVVLMTTTSFTIDMHYCGDTMVDYSFFHKAASCKMQKAALTSSCETPEMKKKSCCSDEQLIVTGQDFKDNFSKLSFEQQVFVASFTYSYISLLEGSISNEVPFVDDSPPFIKRDVQVLHQSFLI